MNLHYCKVGKVKPISHKTIDLVQLEKRHSNIIEKAYNLRQTDASLSDILCYEAKKLKKHIVNLKKALTNDLDISF